MSDNFITYIKIEAFLIKKIVDKKHQGSATRVQNYLHVQQNIYNIKFKA